MTTLPFKEVYVSQDFEVVEGKMITTYSFSDGRPATKADFERWELYRDERMRINEIERQEKEKRARIDEIKQAMKELKEEGCEF